MYSYEGILFLPTATRDTRGFARVDNELIYMMLEQTDRQTARQKL